MNTKQLNLTIEQNQSLLKRVATKFTKDPYEIEELVQETFIRSLSSLERFIHHPKLVAWLFVIMRNVYINNYRKIGKYRTVEAELMSGNHFEQLTYNRGESKFVLHDIQSAIRDLPEDNYRALTMFLDGFNCRTAADSGRNGEDEDTRRPTNTQKKARRLSQKKLKKSKPFLCCLVQLVERVERPQKATEDTDTFDRRKMKGIFRLKKHKRGNDWIQKRSKVIARRRLKRAPSLFYYGLVVCNGFRRLA